MDCSISLRSLTVQGRLAWDTTRAGLELRTGGLLVEEGGEFLVGEDRWVPRERLGETRGYYGGTAVAASLVCGKIPHFISPLSPAPPPQHL